MISAILPTTVYVLYTVIAFLMIIALPICYDVAVDSGPVLLTVFSAAFVCANVCVTVCKKRFGSEILPKDTNVGENYIESIVEQYVKETEEPSKVGVALHKMQGVKAYIPHILLLVLTVIVIVVGFGVTAYSGFTFDWNDGYNYSLPLITVNRMSGPFVADCMFVCQIVFSAVCLSELIVTIVAFVKSYKKKDGARIARRALLAYGIVYFALMVTAFVILVSDTRFNAKAGIYVMFAIACVKILSAIAIMVTNKKRNDTK